MTIRTRAFVTSGSASAIVISLIFLGCGGSADAEQPAADAGGQDSSADTQPPKDAGHDTSPRDTAVEHVPKAPRCVVGPDGDAGVDAVAEVATDALGETPSDADADFDSGEGPDAPDAAIDAPAPYVPVQVVDSGGRVLRAPRIVPITYDSDPNRLDVEDFVASVGCTPYWRAVSEEYGIGQAVTGTPIHLADAPPTTISDAGIEKWLRTQLSAGSPGWERPTPDTIYAVYYPSSTTVHLGSSTSCARFDGFHKSFTLADGTTVVYAVMVDCNDDVDDVTGVSSHEIIEASTDPEPFAAPTYQHVDDAHGVYGLSTGSEVGDLCETDPRAIFHPTGYPFAVQRSWSNRASLGKHDPCVPAQAGTYFNVALELFDTVSTGFTFSDTIGVRIPVGESRTITLQLYADGPIDPWSLSARDISGESPHLSFSFAKSTGSDGDRIALTITKKSESTALGAEPFVVVSSSGTGRRTFAYGLVGH